MKVTDRTTQLHDEAERWASKSNRLKALQQEPHDQTRRTQMVEIMFGDSHPVPGIGNVTDVALIFFIAFCERRYAGVVIEDLTSAVPA